MHAWVTLAAFSCLTLAGANSDQCQPQHQTMAIMPVRPSIVRLVVPASNRPATPTRPVFPTLFFPSVSGTGNHSNEFFLPTPSEVLFADASLFVCQSAHSIPGTWQLRLLPSTWCVARRGFCMSYFTMKLGLGCTGANHAACSTYQ